MTLTIRAMEEGEELRVIALWTAAGLTRPWNDPEQDLRFARVGATSDVLVGHHAAGHLIATAMVGHDGHRGALYYLAVAPERQNEGHGRAMLAAAEAWLRDRGVWKLNLLVREDNVAVISFYEAAGYSNGRTVQLGRRLDEPE